MTFKAKDLQEKRLQEQKERLTAQNKAKDLGPKPRPKNSRPKPRTSNNCHHSIRVSVISESNVQQL